MRSIAIMNQKGGVGKTTTAVNLSAALAETGASVCLIDLDPQAHATLHLGIEPQVEFQSVYEVLVNDLPLKDVRQQVADNLWLIPAHIDLAAAEPELLGVVGRDMILRDKLTQDDMQFDYTIMDCPPSLGVLTLNALTAVDEVFLPLQPQFLALHGLTKLLRTIELVQKRLNNKLRLSGIVFCMFEAQARLSSEIEADVNTFFNMSQSREMPWSNAKIFSTKIRKNIRLAESPSFGKPIFGYDNSSKGAEDYRKLAQEVIESENSK
ncbi:MAG: AAA family ATPase [Planctomycetaceae bacterium]|jgi:chromosome partitioning protein|nr:AAA family ATPase [Planctomycetaceae bacterium]